MSIVDVFGEKVDLSFRQHLVDCVLEHRRLIGDRRWGMVQLYFRTGLSQKEIAEIFDTNRQQVGWELRRAFRLVAGHLLSRRQL